MLSKISVRTSLIIRLKAADEEGSEAESGEMQINVPSGGCAHVIKSGINKQCLNDTLTRL